MGNKHEYLMWREKRGFFSALNRKGELLTWSILTGKLIYSLKMGEDAAGSKLDYYELYKSNANDITYTRNTYNFKDCSLTLLKSMKPVTEHSPEELRELSSNSDIIRLLEHLIDKHNNKSADELLDYAPGMSFDRGSDTVVETKDFGLVDSTLNFNLFHFKVMKLTTYEDNQKLNEIKVKFQFLHRLVRGNAEQEDNDLLDDIDSEWDLGDDPVQHLYLSRSTKRMMEVINNRFAIVYTRKNISEPGSTIR